MTLKHLSIPLALAALLSLSACDAPEATSLSEADEAPLNVLFILTDDQAPYTVAAHGYEGISTPVVDSLAETGMSFEYVFNQGSWSGAVCAPGWAFRGRFLFPGASNMPLAHASHAGIRGYSQLT